MVIHAISVVLHLITQGTRIEGALDDVERSIYQALLDGGLGARDTRDACDASDSCDVGRGRGRRRGRGGR
jgi:hypothetical protein